MKVGVLALQGAFNKHIQALIQLGVEPVEVKTPKDLYIVQGLIIPGGESTVMSNLLKINNLNRSIIEFAKEKPLFGTCAGLILMAKNAFSEKVISLDLLDIEVHRNAYGRQSESFLKSINVSFLKDSFEALFIRAPKITNILSSKVEVLAYLNKTPIFVRQGKHMGACFHPELTNNLSIHRYFLDSL
jgi:5'-phosphate synthase pdxT subunit